jgi:hypothetical protein
MSSLPKIEGMVLLKRKAYWVSRYASIDNGVFSYKKNRGKRLVKSNF